MFKNNSNIKLAAGNLSHGDARKALSEAYKKVFHKEPTDGELDFGLATANFETGYGRASGQFSKWASEGKYNWGALESAIPGTEANFQKFKNAGLHPVKEAGKDAGRTVYFYLFPNDIEAASAFLMSWGRPDTLKAASEGSAYGVAESMKNHGYYEGFWVPPGNPNNRKMPPFKEAKSAEEAKRNNIRDYMSALNSKVAVVTGKKPQKMENITQEIALKPTAQQFTLEGFLGKLNNFLSSFLPSISTASENNKFLVKISAKDYIVKSEYARILQSVLNEELNIESSIHQKNENDIELSCELPFSKEESLRSLKEVCLATSDVFEYATKKFGSYKTSTIILSDKSSVYPEIDIKLSETNRRKFQFKLAQGK